MLESSKGIFDDMHNLTEISDKISQSIQEIDFGITSFEKLVSDVGVMASNSEKEVEELNKEIEKFKV